MATRETLHPEIKRLREDEGLKWREIGARLGLSRSTVFDYYKHPTVDADRARREKYAKVCENCGARTSWNVSEISLCRLCAAAARREWTPDSIIAAIRRWADDHGGVPPVATDWNHGYKGRERYPYPSTVIEVFGTWGDGIRAAGFEAFTLGHYGREGEDPEIVAECVRLYRTGLSLAQVGEVMGCSGDCVRGRLISVGEPRRQRFTGIAA